MTSTSTSSWNLTLDDSSPLFSYVPYGDGAAGDGWATYYSISGFRQAGGDTPLGDSSHVTWSNKSSFMLSYFGKGVYLYGQANCTYDIYFDGIIYPPQYDPDTGLLASFPSTTMDQHNITIVPYATGPDNAFAFDRAVVVVNSPSSELGQTDVYDSQNSTIAYQGTWSQLTDKSIPSTASPAPYQETKAGGSSAILEFQGEGVMISGALNWGHWLYQVTLDEIPSPLYNASAWWIVGDTPLFFRAGLDPKKTHTVMLTNKGTDEGLSTIDLNSITVFGSVSNPSLSQNGTETPQTKPVPIGTIVGAAVGGGVAALLILGLLIFLCLRRRNREQDMSPDLISPDEDKGYTVEPFLSTLDSSFSQPPLGYVTRPSKSTPTIQPVVTEIGHFYTQQQRQPPPPSESNPMSEISSTAEQQGEQQRGEGQRVTLDYGLLAEHVVARLPQARPISSGGQSPPEYVSSSPRSRAAGN